LGFRVIRASVRRFFSLPKGIAAVSVFVLATPAAVADCAPDRVELRGDWGTARFRVEVVDTPESRARGLMFREDLPRMSGMFFVFENERPRSFWMRNTLIPLDIIYFDATGSWVSVQADAVPLDETPRPSEGPAQYVLEINGGLAEQFGMGPGTELRHLRIDPGIAVWPCSE
jgi:hypothetical protein